MEASKISRNATQEACWSPCVAWRGKQRATNGKDLGKFRFMAPPSAKYFAVPIRMRLRRIAHVALASPSACPGAPFGASSLCSDSGFASQIRTDSLRSGLRNCFAIPQQWRAMHIRQMLRIHRMTRWRAMHLRQNMPAGEQAPRRQFGSSAHRL